ncbi:SMI1/KNR4 family protein [Flavobacterium cerinum]|uniref:SMI1/KNR4 family protein n=1 Tax=Flavobacterium cerinum TaxID=2502784 RepID=A0ABY5INB7_9FLAO|nr:SMI1/KNR4 family protein [Flavobacterium cerinum]UUC44114.1 SMI1/KNR4 family protein [Flavobacterium cerinum]
MTQIIVPNSKIDEGQLVEFEKEIEARLPEAYRQFLLLHNGGQPDNTEFTAKKYGGSIIQRFFGFNTPYNTDNFDYIRSTFKDRVPDSFLPIGRDMLGNLILIGIRQKYQGRIYFWWHENESDKKAWFKNIYTISNSFTDFFDNLKEEEEESYGFLVDLFDSDDSQKQLDLINSGWDVNTPLENNFGFAIERLALSGDTEVLKALIAKGANFGEAMEKTLTFGNVEAAGLLLAAGADPNYATEKARNNRDTLLMSAVNTPGARPEIAKLLIEYGADVRVEDAYGWTALKVAVRTVSRDNPEMQAIVDLIQSKLETIAD